MKRKGILTAFLLFFLILIVSAAPPTKPNTPTITPSDPIYTSMLESSSGSGSVGVLHYYYEWRDETDGGAGLKCSRASKQYQCTAGVCNGDDTISVRVLACNVDLGPDPPVATCQAEAGISCNYSDPGLVTIVNTPPTKPVIGISPVEPGKGDILTAHITTHSTDPDNGPDPVTYSYEWSSGETSPTLNCELCLSCLKNTDMSCIVRACDGSACNESEPASVLILNTPPDDPSISLTPSYPYKEDILVAVATSDDIDPGDTITYHFNWTWTSTDPSVGTVTITKHNTAGMSELNCKDDDRCRSGDVIHLYVKACDNHGKGRCSNVIHKPITINYYWSSFAIVGLLIAVSAVALIYMVGIAIASEPMKMLARDELVQIFATALFLGLIFSFVTSLNSPTILDALAGAVGEPGDDLHDRAEGITEDNLAILTDFSEKMNKLILVVGEESSKSGYCSFEGAGFTIATCGSLNSVRGVLSNAYTSINLAIASMQSQLMLLKLSNGMISILLPLGIFLRSFKFTRGAGGALIAISFGFFVAFPTGIILGESIVQSGLEDMGTEFKNNEESAEYIEVKKPTFSFDCTQSGFPPIKVRCWRFVKDPGTKIFCDQYSQRLSDAQMFVNKIKNSDFYEPILFRTIIHSIGVIVLNLIITLTFIRWLSSILGSEIDVSALVRIA